MVDKILGKVAELILKRYWIIVIIGLLITVVASFGARKLGMKYNYQDLLPEGTHSVKVLNDVTQKIGGIGYITLVINTEDVDAAEKYTEVIGKEIEKLPEIRFVDYKTDVEFFKRNSLLYVDKEDLIEINSRFEKKRDFEKKAMNPFFLNLENEKVDLDFADIEKKYSGSGINANEHGFYVAKDKKRMLLLAKPKGLASNLAYAKKVVQDVKDAVAKIDASKFHSSIKVEYTDRYVIMPIENETIMNDLTMSSIVSFIGVMILLLVYTRKIRVMPIVGIPLICGIIWSFGFAYLAIGYVNLVTGFLIGILTGLGIDFGCLLITRYLELRDGGMPLDQTIRKMLVGTGRAVMTASAAEAAAFFVLIFTEFRGFSEFGLIAGMGLLLCMVAMIFMLPSFVIIGEKILPYTPRKIRNGSVAGEPITKYRFYRPILAVTGVVCLLAIIFFGALSFEYNFRNLQVRDLKKLALQDVANETMGISLTPNPILARSFDEVREITKIINDHKKEIEAKGGKSTIDKAVSLMSSIPDDQEEKIKLIAKLKETTSDKIFGYLRGEQAKSLNQFKVALAPEKITQENLPPEIKRVFLGVEDSDTYLMWVFPGVPLWDVNNSKAFVDEIRYINKIKKDPVEVSGESFILADILDLVKKDGVLAIILAFFSVFVILMLDFRSIKTAMLVLSPLFVGVLYLFAVMETFDIRINILNMVMFPVIVGLGIAYGIYVFHRYRENNFTDPRGTAKSIFSGVFLSAGTTVIGFGSLMIAHHKGLNSIGVLASVEITCCFLAGMIFFPAFLQILEDFRNKKKKC